MDNLLLVALCFVLGMWLRRSGRVPAAAPGVLNPLIVNVSLPALAVLHAHEMELSPALAFPALMAWIVFGAGAGLFFLAARRFSIPRASLGALCLTAGLGNTSFVGLPMIEAFYGEEYLGIGMVCDLPGSFMALSTLGIVLAARLSMNAGEHPGQGFDARAMAKKVLGFVPLQAFALGLALRPVEFAPVVSGTLSMLGATLTPLALISVGMAVRFSRVRQARGLLALGLGYKLVLAPIIVLGLYVGLLGAQGEMIRVTIFEAAMPPMVTGGIVASQFDLDPELASLLLGVGIPLGFATLPLWWWVLRLV